MIDAVSTLSVQSSAPRPLPQASASSPLAGAASQADAFFISSRIRVDTELDKAILEFRSSDTGDVIRQYPTESQIRAFQRASELEAEKAAAAASEDVPSEQRVSGGEQQLQAVSVAAAPSPTVQSSEAVTPAPNAAPAPAGDAGSTQSVLI